MVLMTEIMPSRNETPGISSGGMTSTSSPTLWPKLGEPEADSSNDTSPPNLTTDNDEWEFVSEDSSNSSSHDDGRIESLSMNPKILHHCASTPDLNHYESSYPKEDEEEASFDHCSMGVDAQSVVSESSHVLVSHTEKPLTRRVPSFKDAILLNVQETKREEADAAKRREHAQRMLRKEALAKRSKPRLVVKPVVAKMTQRNSRSTGDLNSLLHSYATIHEHDDECYGGGGGGFAAVQEDEEIMGDTDAQDFYAQKSKGGSSRANSKKIRPDEAKRLDIILHKKEEQRRKQRERENGGGAAVRGKKKDTPKKKQKGQ